MPVTLTARAPTIVPFAPDHLDGAAVLLAERHRAHRLVEPGLDQRYEDPDLAREEVGALVRADGASGVACLVDGQLAGFVVGTPRDASWGPNMWVEPAGHAAVDAELVRDLYAAAAERWVADGLTMHYAMLPASDDALVDAWFRLGFGHQQVYAIREAPSAGERSAGPPDLAVRLARREDLDALARSTSRCRRTRRSHRSSRAARCRPSRTPETSTRPTSTTRDSRPSSSSGTGR
jgi:hypothetical protein